MTDHSSQPSSSNEPPNITQITQNGRHFTVTVSKNVSVVPDSENNTSTSNTKSEEATRLSQSNEQKMSQAIIKSDKTVSQPKKVVESLGLNLNLQKSSEKMVVDSDMELPLIPVDIEYPDTHKPAILHAHFDSKRKKINPARPLTDIPEPAPRSFTQSESSYDMFARFEREALEEKQSIDSTLKDQSKDFLEQPEQYTSFEQYTHPEQYNQESSAKSVIFDNDTSKWELIQSPALADHLALLSAGGLAKLPKSFYTNTSVQPLLTSIESMKLIDMSQILSTMNQLSITYNHILTRQGLMSKQKVKAKMKASQLARQAVEDKQKKVSPNLNLPFADDLHNLTHASMWEAILYPQRFDVDEIGLSNISTDIMATSVVKHALLQCPTRQSMNEKLTARDIAKYLRSYLLSQCNQLPNKREHLKHIHIYAGHVILVAQMLGWQVEIVSEGENKGDAVFNVSSRCGLFARYPLLSDYYVKGWD